MTTRYRYHLHPPGLIYVGLAVLVGLAAMNRQNNLLFAVLGFMVAGLLVSGLVSGLMLRGLRVTRLLSHHGAVGRPLVIRYVVNNRNRLLPGFDLHIEERPVEGVCPWGRLMDAAPAWVMHLGPRETAHGEAVFWPRRRGEARFGALRVWTTFPFGLIRKSATFDQPQHTLICPKLYALERRVLDAVGPHGLAGVKISPRPPDPTGGDDYWGMREYRPGDALRQIAWKRSACLDSLVVLERSMPAPPRLRVILNLSTPPSQLGDGGADLEEDAISLAASIIHEADHRGIEVGLTVLAATLVLLFLSAAASAQVINGCIKSNGTLKIADTCSARETPISWNVQGPPGDMGEPVWTACRARTRRSFTCSTRWGRTSGCS